MTLCPSMFIHIILRMTILTKLLARSRDLLKMNYHFQKKPPKHTNDIVIPFATQHSMYILDIVSISPHVMAEERTVFGQMVGMASCSLQKIFF